MNPIQIKNALVVATSCILLSACSGDSDHDSNQPNNSEQQLQTELDNITTIVGQESLNDEIGYPIPVVPPSPVQNQSDDENSTVADPSIQSHPGPDMSIRTDSDAEQESFQVSTMAFDTNDPALAPVQDQISVPDPETTQETTPEPAPEPNADSHFTPHVLITWQLQLQGSLNASYDAELYVMDLFDTPKSKIATLRNQGIAVICYFSAGTFEEWRSDSNEFEASDLGRNLDDWPGERWLDVRSQNVRRIMTTRLDIARLKGCDGVDPDNVDGYSNPTGIGLSNSDQLSFNKFLANQAHSRGLAIGLKNNVGQVEDLVEYYDFTINESCDRYNECDRLEVFVDQEKPVLHVEYRPDLLNMPSAFSAYCQKFIDKQFSSLVLPRALDDEYRLSCQ